MSKPTIQDDAVMALSVYNAISLTGRDMTVDEIVQFLAVAWPKPMSRNASRVRRLTVTKAARRLMRDGFAVLDDGRVILPVRDPRTRQGAPLLINYQTGALERPATVARATRGVR